MKFVSLCGLLLLTSALPPVTSAATRSASVLTSVALAAANKPASNVSASSISAFTKGMLLQQGYFDFYHDAKTDKV